MKTILCYDSHGYSHQIPRDEVAFRPAVYGILIERDQALLARHPVTDYWQPPGRILDGTEAARPALAGYVRSVTGQRPVVGALLMLEEQYRRDDDGRAWCLSVAYYALERPLDGLVTPVDVAAPEHPAWVPLITLGREQMQFGFDAIQIGRQLQQT